ncbi:MAG: hypothetical protein IPM68_18020 [Flavobacteriales bacterium]|nr:hypothetical protein [Flavobacteriales bacterium]
MLFIFSVVLSTIGFAQTDRNAVLDTLDARHDKSKSAMERLEIMSMHAEALFAQGRSAERAELAKEYMTLAQEVGTDSVLAHAYGMLAGREDGGSMSASLKYYLLAREHAIKANDGRQVGFTEKEIGTLYKDLKDYATAMRYLKRAQAEVSDPGQVNRVSCHIGEIMLALGKPDSALFYAQRSNVFVNPADDPYGYARSQLVLGNAYAALGERDQSDAFLRRCVTICDSFDVVLPLPQALTAQTAALIAAGRASEAIITGKRSLAIAARSPSLSNDIDAADVLWKAYRAAGKSDSALVYSVLVSQLKDSLARMADRATMEDLILNSS